MIIGRIIGAIYSTINHPFMDGKKLMVVRKITPEGKDTEDYLIAVDTVGAGVGENVLIVDEGNSARQTLKSDSGPVRSVIVGIVDEIALAEKTAN